MKGSKKFISICVALLIGRTGFVMPLQTAAHDDAIITDASGFEIFNGNYLIGYSGTGQSELFVPEGIEYIGENCFFGCTELEKIHLPDSLTTIEQQAFAVCMKLESLEIPDSVTVIEEQAFFGCTSLKEIVLPTHLTELSAKLFTGCSSLKSVAIQSPITTIPDSVFYGCTSLAQIQIPDTVTRIESSAFAGCTWLTDHCTTDGFTVLNEKYLLTYRGDSSKYRQVSIPEGVEFIANNALHGNKIYEISCPSSLQRIGDGAFADCTRLAKLHLNDGLAIIGKNIVPKNQYFKSLRIPSSVIQMGEQTATALNTIYGEAGTFAEQFAADNHLIFCEGEEQPPSGKDMTLDFTKDIWSFGNSSAAFGSGYYLTDADRAHLTELGIDTENMDGNWSGSCVGLSVAVILAKNGVVSPAQLQADAQTLNDVTPDKAVQSFINYYQCLQGRTTTPPESFESAVEIFYRMTQIAANVKFGESPFLLTFALASGSHGVVGYGQESGEWEFDGKRYDTRILVWDSNYPTALHDASCLYYDSATFDYCIPQYGVHVADNATGNVGGIITVCNDLSVLNAYPYPREESAVAGDVTNDGQCNVQDVNALVRWLTEEDSPQMIVWRNGDCNHDGKLTGIDLTLLKRMLL